MPSKILCVETDNRFTGNWNKPHIIAVWRKPGPPKVYHPSRNLYSLFRDIASRTCYRWQYSDSLARFYIGEDFWKDLL